MANPNANRYQDLIMAATRYYLGECSAEARIHVGWLTTNWADVTRRDLLVADIARVLADNRPRGSTSTPAAWPEYAALWAGFLNLAWVDLPPERQATVLRWLGPRSDSSRLLLAFGPVKQGA